MNTVDFTHFETMDIVNNFILQHASHQVRTENVDGDNIYLASDIGKMLGIRKIEKHIKDLDDEDAVARFDSPRDELFLTEKGVTRLFVYSDKPVAKEFRNLLINNILKPIGKHGKVQF